MSIEKYMAKIEELFLENKMSFYSNKMSASNYLKITDRKKDIIVSLGGDNTAPSKIENLLTLSPEIEQACVFGEQKNYIAALLVLSLNSK